MRKMVFFMALLCFSGWLYAGTAAENVMVSDAYVRAVPPGQPNSASFMVIKNNSSENLALVGAESAVAKALELHTHTMKDGMMRMRQVKTIDLPAGDVVSLQPGGLHVMVIGLQQKLIPGEQIDMALVFSDGSKLELKVPVVKLQLKMQDAGMKSDMKHKMH